MRFQSSPVSFASKIDMTPMIDCVFQLILFFVLSTQIAVAVEDVDLPVAVEGSASDASIEGKLTQVINVLVDNPVSRTAKLAFNGRTIAVRELEEALRQEVAYDAAPRPSGRGAAVEFGPGGQRLSRISVLIRADRDVQSESLRAVFGACQRSGIDKVRLATRPSDGD